MNTSTTRPDASENVVFAEPQGSASGNGLPPKRPGSAAVDNRRSMQKLVSWGSKGGLAVLDQALISGSNFVVSILLGRWLMPDQYGAYAVAFGIYIMLSLVYQSLVLEPMGVFGGSVFRSNLRGYLKSLVWLHVVLSVTICSALVISWAVAHRLGAGAAMTSALSAPASSGSESGVIVMRRANHA